jgi:dUTP pyrophosphatase
MNNINIKISVSDISLVPKYSTDGSAGADLKSAEYIVIPARQRQLVKTGVYVEIPEGCVGLIHPRSGLALKNGITVLNTPGTIDSDYRGEIGVILYNSSDKDFPVMVGDRIAQIVFQQYAKAEFQLSEALDNDTDRGAGGFGSTGING